MRLSETRESIWISRRQGFEPVGRRSSSRARHRSPPWRLTHCSWPPARIRSAVQLARNVPGASFETNFRSDFDYCRAPLAWE